jgi:hypothetical protein
MLQSGDWRNTEAMLFYRVVPVFRQEEAMDSTIWIALIVAAAVIIVLFMFRRDIRKFFVKASRDGVEAGLETRDPAPSPPPAAGGAPGRAPGVNIKGNTQAGAGNRIGVAQSDVNVEDNKQLGRDQSIEVKRKK